MWVRRTLVALPLVVATVLTVLVSVADRFQLQRQHIAGYCFLFAAPWDWLLDRGWFGTVQSRSIHVQSRSIQLLVACTFILWIPALLYSGGLLFVFRLLRLWRTTRAHTSEKLV
jgi:hypothetical protein